MARSNETTYKALVCNNPTLTSGCRCCWDCNDAATRHCAGHPRWVSVAPPLEPPVSTFSVQPLSRVQLFATPRTAAHQAPCPSPTPRVHPTSCPLSRWCHPTISSSVVPFSSCPQSFPASGSFPMTQLFASGGQSIGGSASASVLPMNIQSWFLKPSFKVGVSS